MQRSRSGLVLDFPYITNLLPFWRSIIREFKMRPIASSDTMLSVFVDGKQPKLRKILLTIDSAPDYSSHELVQSNQDSMVAERDYHRSYAA